MVLNHYILRQPNLQGFTASCYLTDQIYCVTYRAVLNAKCLHGAGIYKVAIFILSMLQNFV